MAKVVLVMVMSLDGFFSGPSNEMDWMVQVPDPEFIRDTVSSLDRFDRGFMGYPQASWVLPYWLSVASNPQAPPGQRDIAAAVNRLRPFLVSDREEPVPWQNAELLVVHGDEQLTDAVLREKEKPGKDLGITGGIRTAQTFVRLGLVDEYVLTVHPITLGSGKRVFTGKTALELVGAKTYRSGVVRTTYSPAR